MASEPCCLLVVFVLLLGLFVGIALLHYPTGAQKRELNYMLAQQLKKWKKTEPKREFRDNWEKDLLEMGETHSNRSS